MSEKPATEKQPVHPQVMKRTEQALKYLGCEHMTPWARFRLTGTSRTEPAGSEKGEEA